MHDFLAAAWTLAGQHAAVLSLVVLAFIVTMPDELPPPLNRVAWLVWAYRWAHDGLKTFVSFRSPSAAPRVPPPRVEVA